MELKLKRPLLFFDIESTGLNIATDSIVELSCVKISPAVSDESDVETPAENKVEVKTWRLCPWDYIDNHQKKMDPGAQKVHGISDDDVKDCPRFVDKVSEIGSFLAGCDLAGFNSAKFDLPLLVEEFERVRTYYHKNFKMDLHDVRMVDVQNIYHQKEPRNLKAAHIFYCGCDFDGAHGAEADTMATYDVLKGQLDRYLYDKESNPEGLQNDVEWLAQFSTGMKKTVDFAGRLIYNSDGEIIISFGKHKGKTAREVFDSDPSYFSWIASGEFTLDTKRQFEKLRQQFIEENRQKDELAKSRPASAEGLNSLLDKFGHK